MNKALCRQLRRRGLSIGHIAQRLSLSESTVHWHVKDLVLSGAQRAKLRREKREFMARVNARRRGKPLHPVAFRRPAWNKALVQLIAHLSFDGRIDRYGCHYYNNSQQQMARIHGLLRTLLGIEAAVRQRPTGIWRLSYYNVEVAHWLACREKELLAVLRRQLAWRQVWLKALFDDEGHVHYSKGRRRVRASQQDRKVLRYARNALQALNIDSRIDSQAQAVEITGRQNLQIFSQRIGFSPGIFINEHRQNGLRRQPIEKQALLELALASYRN